MRAPTDYELHELVHRAIDGGYDPAKAHQYYELHKKLKGRRRGTAQPLPARPRRPRVAQPTAHRAQQKVELQARITNLSKKLQELEQLIQKKEATLKKDQSLAKSKAKKERGTKAKNKPQTAAEKAKAARENKQFREKHKQELKTKAKQARQKSGGGSSSKQTAQKPNEMPIKALKTLATKVKGQIAVAKQKLAAL